MQPRDPDVTVLIPAYRSGDFFESALESVRRQTYPNFRAVISIDGPDARTEAVAGAVADTDPRFEVVVQPERLGWLGNTNALFDRVATEFFFIFPHDDLLHDTYLENLRHAALQHPQAVNVHCDMERVGRTDDLLMAPDLSGPFLARVTAMLSAGAEGVPWRGLTRRSALDGGLRMRGNAFDSYNAHSLWVLALLCLGPFRRVPLPLYRQRQRHDDRSVSVGWRAFSAERRHSAMTEHTLHCMETVSTLGTHPPAERQATILLLLLRHLARPEPLDARAPIEGPGVDRHLIRAAELLARLYGLEHISVETMQRLRFDESLRGWMAKLKVSEAAQAFGQHALTAASAAVEQALALDPASGDAFRRKAAILHRQGRLEEAVAAIREARRLLPRDARVARDLANILHAAGDLDNAIAAAREALALDSRLAGAHFRLSVLLARAGQPAEALASAARAVEADPHQSRYREHHEALRRSLAVHNGAERAPDR
jgi:hypothetical protein